jgi:hypothetical protein
VLCDVCVPCIRFINKNKNFNLHNKAFSQVMNLSPDVQELGRRRNASFVPLQETIAASGICNRKFKADDQQYAVINVAQTKCLPASEKPAIRVLGLFPDTDSASKFARTLYSCTDHRCSIRIVDTCGWHLAAQSEHAPYIQTHAKVLKILKNKWEEVVRYKDEFDANYESKVSDKREPLHKNHALNPAYIVAKKGLDEMVESEKILQSMELTSSELRETKESSDNTENAIECNRATSVALEGSEHSDDAKPEQVEYLPTNPDTTTALRLEKSSWDRGNHVSTEFNSIPGVLSPHRLPSQNICVVSFMEDSVDGTEPAFCIFGAFPDEKNAKIYDNNVLKCKMPEHDICGVDMYEWIYPEQMTHSDVETLYRMDEQNRLMQRNASRDSDIEMYREVADTLGKEVKVKEVIADLDHNGNRLPNAVSEQDPEDPSLSRIKDFKLVHVDEILEQEEGTQEQKTISN